MTLSQRTILIIVSTFIALLFILATTSDLILLSSYSALEKADITSHTRHISYQIDDKLNQLYMTAQEIADQLPENSDRSVSLGRKAGALCNIHFMRSHALDLVTVFDTNGHIFVVNGFNGEKNELNPVPVEQQKELASMASRITVGNDTPLKGVIHFSGSPLMVAVKQIYGQNGEKRGIVAVGQFIDRVEMERIFRASGATITLYDLKSSLATEVEKAVTALESSGNIHASVIDETSIAGYFTLKDIFGDSSFIVRTVEKRILYEHGKVTIAYIFIALFMAGSVICAVMLLFVRVTILQRLQSLTTRVLQITELRDISARLPLTEQQDELKTLAVSINSMLESLEHADVGMRESEERYRMLFDRAPDAIIIIGLEGDEAGRVVAANQAAAEQHGYSMEELLTLNISDLNTAETNKIAGDMTATVATGEWLTAEIWHQKKDGTQFPIEIHAGLIKIGGKKYILGFDRDITQRKITEETDHMHLEQIRQLNDELSRKALELAAANNELESFNFSVSHDMRGPLTRISGYCQLLLDDEVKLDPDVREYIARIYESEKWLNDMIDALLHLTQLTRVEIISGSVNLSSIAEAALNDLSVEFPDRSVSIHVQADIVVAGDARLLKMVMINLLNNAWKYSAYTKEALIECGVMLTDTGPVYYVRDNGAGFDMKDVNKLFRVFTRLHDSSQFSGTGIGLATVQRIIFRHGGRIWAEAIPGHGATFYFTLP
jgi:PAS domain S-box-containing protein